MPIISDMPSIPNYAYLEPLINNYHMWMSRDIATTSDMLLLGGKITDPHWSCYFVICLLSYTLAV